MSTINIFVQESYCFQFSLFQHTFCVHKNPFECFRPPRKTTKITHMHADMYAKIIEPKIAFKYVAGKYFSVTKFVIQKYLKVLSSPVHI